MTQSSRFRAVAGFVLLVSLVLSSAVVCAEDGAIEKGTLAWGGLDRDYRLFVPTSLSEGKRVPLVMMLHGGTSNGRQVEFYTGFDTVAAREGFLVVYPDAHEGHWNDGRTDFPSKASEQNIDDVGFLMALVARIQAIYPVDPQRVYVVGVSNGGMMAQRLAAERSETFAAAAMVISSIPAALMPSLKPKAPISVLMLNGTDDPLVKWEGGELRIGKLKPRGMLVSVDDAVSFWVKHNGCKRPPERRWLDPVEPKDETRVWQETFPGGRDGTEVVFYGIEGGGHGWPGASLSLPRRLLGDTSHNLDATEVIWDFFARHHR